MRRCKRHAFKFVEKKPLSSINGTILQMNTLKSNLNSPKKEDKDVDLVSDPTSENRKRNQKGNSCNKPSSCKWGGRPNNRD